MKKLLVLSLILLTSSVYGFTINNGSGTTSIPTVERGNKQVLKRVLRVYNNSANTLPKFTLVRINSTHNGMMTIDKCGANFFADNCFGMTIDGGQPFRNLNISISGLITDINTSEYEFNDELYLSETNGEFTTTPGKISIGVVLKVGETDGQILLNIIRKK